MQVRGIRQGSIDLLLSVPVERYSVTKSTGAREAQWDSTFNQVEEFLERHGRLPGTTRYDQDEAYLGKWLVRQRRKHAGGRLSDKREARLVRIGALAPPNEPEFMEKVEACAAFIEKNGRPPKLGTDDPTEKALYYWRAGQQHLQSVGRLKPHREKILEERGIFRSAHEYQWRRNFKALERFVKERGRAPVRLSDNAEEASLGQWRQEQFALYSAGKLDRERAEMLEKLGIATTVPNLKWNRRFRQLQAFTKTRNAFPSRSSDNEEELRLSRWLETQRKLIKAEELTPRRRRLIESLELPEDRLEARWNKTLREVRTFVAKHGRLPSNRAKAKKERSLAVWCYRQRTQLKEGTLKRERIEPIEDLGLHLDRKSEQWRNRYKQVYHFMSKYDRPPNRRAYDREERTLGRWCEHQKYLHSRGKLSRDRLAVLRSAGLLRSESSEKQVISPFQATGADFGIGTKPIFRK